MGVSDSEKANPNPAVSRLRHYADILNPVFWHDSFNKVDTLFEFICTLLRVAGMKDTGWESYNESLAFLEDMDRLGNLHLPRDIFPEPFHTRARLALIAYSHATEMNMPYDLLANLLRLRIGKKYCTDPFAHLATSRNVKRGGATVFKRMAASPEKKIKFIEEISLQARLPEIGAALREIYDPVIRNAVFHSDYVLHGTSMHLLSDFRKPSKQEIRTPVVELHELISLTANAFGFHSALIALYKRACRSMTDFRGRFLPFDPFYKGILELTFEEDVLTGFRAYWPNGTISTYCRSVAGHCDAINLDYNPDGSINFSVGVFANKPGSFSPCVEANAAPLYGMVPGSQKRPYWPNVLQAYEL